MSGIGISGTHCRRVRAYCKQNPRNNAKKCSVLEPEFLWNIRWLKMASYIWLLDFLEKLVLGKGVQLLRSRLLREGEQETLGTSAWGAAGAGLGPSDGFILLLFANAFVTLIMRVIDHNTICLEQVPDYWRWTTRHKVYEKVSIALVYRTTYITSLRICKN